MSEPTGLGPSYDTDEQFAGFAAGLVQDNAPRLFALVVEFGERVDADVAGYGLAYVDRAEFTSLEGDFHITSETPERVRLLVEASAEAARVHLVWLVPNGD